ncbi:MAG: phosphoglucosamine mutase, partial [Candidatus Thorarchaeota archaeon]|nr:phosphoglucosamine mutase [Candidatus Thorarchaeota archaeon]
IGTVLGPGKVVVGRDARKGGEMFSRAAISGLLSTGCSVIDIGPAPTPTLQFVVPRLDCIAGIIVTASHNPAEFNGIKVMGVNGIEVSREREREIESVLRSGSYTIADWQNIKSVTNEKTAVRQHIDGIKSHIDTEAIKGRNLTVIVDSANSVGALVTPPLMRDLGCKVVSLNSQLDGSFPGRPPEPSPENVVELLRTVKSVGADIGIAHDGDADRATFVDENGTVVSGDQSLAIIASRILSIKQGSILVTPVSSGKLIEDIVEKAGGKIDWTVVGSVDVSHRVGEIGADLGGEENGGVFYPPHQSVRDGSMTSALLVDIMVKEGKSLSELVQELPVYYTTKRKMKIPVEKMEFLMTTLLDMTKDQNRITIDGIKIFRDTGWILIRPSGTEPIYRCFSEGPTQEKSDMLCDEGMILIKNALTQS